VDPQLFSNRLQPQIVILLGAVVIDLAVHMPSKQDTRSEIHFSLVRSAQLRGLRFCGSGRGAYVINGSSYPL
jgi:hypothetical protein